MRRTDIQIHIGRERETDIQIYIVYIVYIYIHRESYITLNIHYIGDKRM